MTRVLKKDRCVFSWFMGFTSLGGLTQSNNTDIREAKVIWFVLFLVGLSFSIWNTWGVFQDYSKNEVMTTISMDSPDYLDFPAITLCSVNKVHCGNLLRYIEQCETNSSWAPCSNHSDPLLYFCALSALGRCDIVVEAMEKVKHGKSISPKVCSESPELELFLKQIANQEIKASRQDVVQAIFISLEEEQRLAISHRPQDMIAECKFNNRPGHEECLRLMAGAQTVNSPNYGICYSFNYIPPDQSDEIDTRSPIQSSLVGVGSGLSLILNIETDHFMMNQLTETEGVKVIIHEAREIPMTSTKGYSIQAATETQISLERHEIFREGPPYKSNCSATWPDTQGPSVLRYPYLTSLCQNYCIDDHFINKCNCSYKGVIEHDRHKGTPCDMNKESLEPCLESTITELGSHIFEIMTNCDCPQQCRETIFRASLSSFKWPSSMFVPYLAERFKVKFANQTVGPDLFIDAFLKENNLTTVGNLLERFSRIQDMMYSNFLKLDIFFSTQSINQVKEYPKYNLNTLFSSLGGALSLYIGMSLITLFEGLELTFRLIRNQFFTQK